MTRPELTVLVPSVNTLRDVRDCLTCLARESEEVDLEVIVIDRQGPYTAAAVRDEFPFVKVLEVEPGVTIPQMRALGFDAARGEAVAVLEDHVMVPPGWARRILAELATSDGVVAGSVENAATDTLLDWACFLCEYSHLIPPIQGGDVPWLTGNNVAYRRGLLQRFAEATHAGKWENHLHDTLRAAGVRLICVPDLVVGHKKRYTFGEYLSQRYFYARSYAGARVAESPFPRRVLMGLAAFALPPLLLVRISRRIWEKGRYNGLLLKSLPLIACFVVSWGLGEVVGYLRGPGDTLAKVC